MRLESFRIFNCFGFVDSGEINLGEPGNLVYFLGRNSSGKTSVLRAISLFAYGVVPSQHSKFTNYEETFKGTSYLRAQFSIDPVEGQTLSVDTMMDVVIQSSASPWEVRRDEEGHAISHHSAAAIAIVDFLNHVHETYSDLKERIQGSGRTWITKFGNGRYVVSTEEADYQDYISRRDSIKAKIQVANDAFAQEGVQVRLGSSFEDIEGQLFAQFPDIYVFNDRFSLDQDLPRFLGEEHLQGGQNELTEAFITLLGRETLSTLLRVHLRSRIRSLTQELQGRLDALCYEVNADATKSDTTEGLVWVHVERTGSVRVVLEVDGKESYYEHLSDNTKFLIAYYILQKGQESTDSPNSILLPKARCCGSWKPWPRTATRCSSQPTRST